MTAPNNSFNIGRDGYQLTILDPLFGQVTINGITSFDAKPDMIKLKSVTVDGNIRRRAVFDGHTGKFQLDREDATFDNYFAAQEANYFANIAPSLIVITHTINELDGSQSQFQYTNVALYPSEWGSWKGQEKVVQAFDWEAGRRIKTL
jgi:hypothetical protein